jgi:phage baseplate assembly protein V
MDRDMLSQLRHVLRPLASRVANVVARGVVHLVDDAQKLQLVQLGVLADETIDAGEHHQPYGFSSVPLPGAEAVAVFPGGDRGHPLVLAVSDRRHRPTGGQAGEVVLYTDEGDTVRLGRGHVVVVATTGQIKLGSSSASQAAILGTQRNSAEQTFLAALYTFVGAIVDSTGAPTAAKVAFLSAIASFQLSLIHI